MVEFWPSLFVSKVFPGRPTLFSFFACFIYCLNPKTLVVVRRVDKDALLAKQRRGGVVSVFLPTPLRGLRR